MTVNENEETVEYLLHRSFTNKDIDRYGNVTSTSSLSYYSRRDSGHGNGYCGMKTTYRIIRAKVVKARREIDLDNDSSDDVQEDAKDD
jgi:hypothetical protein